jgi:hypothetical protein
MCLRFGTILSDWPVLLRMTLGMLLVGFMIIARYPGWLWSDELVTWSLPGPIPDLFVCGSALLFLVPIDIVLSRRRLSVGDLLLIFALDLVLLLGAFPSLHVKRQVSPMIRSHSRDPRLTTCVVGEVVIGGVYGASGLSVYIGLRTQ